MSRVTFHSNSMPLGVGPEGPPPPPRPCGVTGVTGESGSMMVTVTSSALVTVP